MEGGAVDMGDQSPTALAASGMCIRELVPFCQIENSIEKKSSSDFILMFYFATS